MAMDLNCLIKNCDVDLEGHELLDKSDDFDGCEHEFPEKDRGLTRWG